MLDDWWMVIDQGEAVAIFPSAERCHQYADDHCVAATIMPFSREAFGEPPIVVDESKVP